MRSVLLSGYYGFGNTGDEAILASTVKALREADPGLKIMVLSRNPKDTSLSYEVECFQRMSPIEVSRAMNKADLVVFGGGSLLQDSTSFRSLLYYIAIIYAARLLGKPLVVYANGIGPIRSKIGRFLAKKALSTARKITVRDRESRDELIRLGIKNEVDVTADPAFLLSPASPEKVEEVLRAANVPEKPGIVFIAIRAIDAPSWFYPEIISAAQYLRGNGFFPAFLLMQDRDREIAEQLNGQIKRRGQEPLPVVGNLSPEDALGVLAKSDFCVGMRLHTLILAARAEVPFIGLEIDPKIGAFCRAAGCPVLPAPKDSRNFDLIAACQHLAKNRDAFAATLKRNLCEFQALAKKNIDMILSVLNQCTSANSSRDLAS